MLAQELNYTRAAERCRVSQPALTQAIRRIEAELSGQLIERTGSKIQLSALGEGLLDKFQHMNTLGTSIKSDASKLIDRNLETLNLGISHSVGVSCITNMLSEFCKDKNTIPTLRVSNLANEQISLQLRSQTIDAAFMLANDSSRLYQNHFVYNDHMCVVCRQDDKVAQQPTLSLADLAGLPYLDRLKCDFRTTMFERLAHIGVEPDIVASSERDDFVQSLAAQGFGIAVFPQHTPLISGLVSRPIKDSTRAVHIAIANSAFAACKLKPLMTFAQQYWRKSTHRAAS